MDREQVQQARGILEESAGIVRRHSRLFSTLSCTLILPLCFMLLAHHLVSSPLLNKMMHNEDFIEAHDGSPAAARREAVLDSEWAILLTFFTGYLLFVLAFSLVSTSAIVYSIACIYTNKPVSYSKVLGVVPTVWKRLCITFLWVFIIIMAYHVLAILSVSLVIGTSNAFVSLLMLTPLVAAFFVLHVYVSCVWHLASVISVLEDDYGIPALRKSLHLIKGRKALAFALFSLYSICGGSIGILFKGYVVHVDHGSNSLLVRLVIGALLVALLTIVTLFGMMAQTVFYFACKLFHNEQVDWSALSEHLGAYMGEYVPLKSAIQMEDM